MEKDNSLGASFGADVTETVNPNATGSSVAGSLDGRAGAHNSDSGSPGEHVPSTPHAQAQSASPHLDARDLNSDRQLQDTFANMDLDRESPRPAASAASRSPQATQPTGLEAQLEAAHRLRDQITLDELTKMLDGDGSYNPGSDNRLERIETQIASLNAQQLETIAVGAGGERSGQAGTSAQPTSDDIEPARGQKRGVDALSADENAAKRPRLDSMNASAEQAAVPPAGDGNNLGHARLDATDGAAVNAQGANQSGSISVPAVHAAQAREPATSNFSNDNPFQSGRLSKEGLARLVADAGAAAAAGRFENIGQNAPGSSAATAYGGGITDAQMNRAYDNAARDHPERFQQSADATNHAGGISDSQMNRAYDDAARSHPERFQQSAGQTADQITTENAQPHEASVQNHDWPSDDALIAAVDRAERAYDQRQNPRPEAERMEIEPDNSGDARRGQKRAATDATEQEPPAKAARAHETELDITENHIRGQKRAAESDGEQGEAKRARVGNEGNGVVITDISGPARIAGVAHMTDNDARSSGSRDHPNSGNGEASRQSPVAAFNIPENQQGLSGNGTASNSSERSHVSATDDERSAAQRPEALSPSFFSGQRPLTMETMSVTPPSSAAHGELSQDRISSFGSSGQESASGSENSARQDGAANRAESSPVMDTDQRSSGASQHSGQSLVAAFNLPENQQGLSSYEGNSSERSHISGTNDERSASSAGQRSPAINRTSRQEDAAQAQDNRPGTMAPDTPPQPDPRGRMGHLSNLEPITARQASAGSSSRQNVAEQRIATSMEAAGSAARRLEERSRSASHGR